MAIAVAAARAAPHTPLRAEPRRRPRRGLAWAAAIAGAALVWAAPATAQLGASVALHTDYRYRGYSLSQARAAATLSLAYDQGAGPYAGGSLIAADTARDGWRPTGYLAYAGYARRFARGPTWDLGASTLRVKAYDLPYRSMHNDEIYAGVVGEHVSLRLAYAPDYFQLRRRTLYADLGAAVRPAPAWRVFGHAGLLSVVGGGGLPGGRRERYDLAAGVARRLGRLEILLQATEASPDRTGGPDHDGLALAASFAF